MESNIKTGDAVKTKAGGPGLIVSKIIDDRADCMWFDQQNLAPLSASFPVNGLVLIQDNSK